jgi:hypothetical protein
MPWRAGYASQTSSAARWADHRAVPFRNRGRPPTNIFHSGTSRCQPSPGGLDSFTSDALPSDQLRFDRTWPESRARAKSARSKRSEARRATLGGRRHPAPRPVSGPSAMDRGSLGVPLASSPPSQGELSGIVRVPKKGEARPTAGVDNRRRRPVCVSALAARDRGLLGVPFASSRLSRGV